MSRPILSLLFYLKPENIRLSLNIAHQYITQLEENIKNAVFGNVGSMAVFRVGTEDATFWNQNLNRNLRARYYQTR
jgi:hypothetical protein